MVLVAALVALIAVAAAVLAVARASASAREARSSLRSLEAALDCAPVSLVLLDRRLRVVHANETVTRFSGHSATDLVGRQFGEVADRPDLRAAVQAVLATGVPALAIESRGTTTDGRPFRAFVDLYPVRVDGEITGVGVIVHDVTATARVDEERRGLLDRLARLQRITEALARARTSADVVRAVVDDFSDTTWAMSATLLVRTGDDLSMVGTGSDEEETERLLHGVDLDDDRPVLHAMRERRLLLVGPDEIAARWPAISAKLGPGESLAALPLVDDDDQLVGGMVLRMPAGGATAMRDEVFLSAVGNQTAGALRRIAEQERGEAAHAASATRLAYLAEASDALGASLDSRLTLRRVAELAVPRLADAAAALIIDGSQIVDAEFATTPEHEDVIRRLVKQWPAAASRPGAAALVRDRQPVLVADLAEANAAATGMGSASSLLVGAGFQSLIAVPMTGDGRVVGILVLATECPRSLGPTDLELATELAARAGQAILNAERFQERSYVADALQATLLPPATPAVPGLEVATRFFAVGEGIDVGGDFYDVFRMGTAAEPDDRWAVVIGDVRGKGPEAAGISGTARNAIRAAALHERSPARILGQLNELLLVTSEGELEPRFCTAVLAVVQPERARARITLSVGGHPAPLVLRAGGTTESVTATGSLLGILDDAELQDVTLDLSAGDALVLYTDGVTERHAGDRFFDEDTFRSVLSRCAGFTAPVLAERIETASRAFVEDLPRDDLAVVVVRVPEAVASASAASTDLPNDVTAPTLGRRFVTAALDALGLQDRAETAALLASELVTNALVHAQAPYCIAVESGEGVLRIGVSDGTTTGPQLSPEDAYATSGRGLRLIESLTDRWGVHLVEGGKTIWFELDT